MLRRVSPVPARGKACFTNGFRILALRIPRVPAGPAWVASPAAGSQLAGIVVLPMVLAIFRITVRFLGSFFLGMTKMKVF